MWNEPLRPKQEANKKYVTAKEMQQRVSVRLFVLGPWDFRSLMPFRGIRRDSNVGLFKGANMKMWEDLSEIEYSSYVSLQRLYIFLSDVCLNKLQF